MQAQRKTIAIIGGGPAGSTLATLLARKGHKVGIYHLPKRPPLIVGESLLPAVIPILRLLGVEEEIKSFSTFKPGATICLDDDHHLAFGFDEARTASEYAYNVPRDKFDATILKAAEAAGARIFHHRAVVEKDEATGKVSLDENTIAAAEGFFKNGVDLIVDASGRSRYLPGFLQLEAEEGERKDTALFAHMENVTIEDEGHIHVDLHEKGWGWRIPLPGRVSVGVVVHPDHLKSLGGTKEEQFDTFIKMDPMMREQTKDAKRISPVLSYNNYQWKSKQLFGNGWALVGDTGGFIDPVFSTGLFLAMDSGVKLAAALEAGTLEAMEKYQHDFQAELYSWQSIISNWYNGKLPALFEMKKHLDRHIFGRIMNLFVARHVTRIFTGEIPSGSFSHKLLHFMFKHGIRGEVDYKEYAVV
ncbi:MAG: NAD(P)/FAD-dependent oxidoreductase [Saprospiraceae bacterium]|nr:NAD(P)/FAD-dependent oxidoreductase [Saprospiraceae bacterium]